MRYFLALVGIALIAAAAVAADVTSVHPGQLNGSRPVAAVDSVAPLASSDYLERPIACGNRRTVLVSPSCQNSGATIKVALALGDYRDGTWTPKAWVETSTLTASSTFKLPNGYYAVPSVELPTGNWSSFRVHVTALSAGAAEVEWSAY